MRTLTRTWLLLFFTEQSRQRPHVCQWQGRRGEEGKSRLDQGIWEEGIDARLAATWKEIVWIRMARESFLPQRETRISN